MLRRGFVVAAGLIVLGASAALAADLQVADAKKELSALSGALGQSGACKGLGPIVKEYVVDKGLDLGLVVEAALKACGDLDSVVLAALESVTSVSRVTQAAEFAGGDAVEVEQSVEKARLALEQRGITVNPYTPAPAQSLDRVAQTAPHQVSPTLWGAPTRDAGPDRTRASVSPSNP